MEQLLQALSGGQGMGGMPQGGAPDSMGAPMPDQSMDNSMAFPQRQMGAGSTPMPTVEQIMMILQLLKNLGMLNTSGMSGSSQSPMSNQPTGMPPGMGDMPPRGMHVGL